MKNIIKITFITLMFFGTFSCSDDFVDLAPITYANEADFYKTDGDFEAAIVSVYNGFKSPATQIPFNMEYRADNLKFSNYTYQELSTNVLGANTGSFLWGMYSSLIYPTNNILDRLEVTEGITSSVKDVVSGEALFFRGYAYYWLTLGFGRVPIVTSVITSDEALELGLSSEDEVLAQAVADFQKAASLLPATSSVFGKLDKYDAMAFQAKALMLQNNWSAAVPVLQEIYNNSGHQLEPVWTDMWTTAAEKTSKEFMFQVIYSELANNNSFAQQLLYIRGDNTTQEVFMYKPGLFESFEDGDIRRDETLGFDIDGIAENRKYDFGKVGNIWTQDIQVLRFTEIQLLYAEAISMAAGSVQQQSLDLINEIRNRAGLGDLVMADVPNMNAFIEAVLAERRAEFVFEGKRYADLKRHNLLVSKLNAIGYSFDDSYNYLPIPQNEKDKVPDGLYDN
ncbi:RagB/SusD family nutrient uptake outer membrane protein [Aestuariivivens sp. NBU2969]|uniref:RagB/SusD family nutrient uptake outer membrane protein n=1 Tax=Aestuariivivens sp. NBU2969 TaxID=2873267 RepID=UPI001CBAD3F9|nr:RagB/SusD family nutrient uptake outer membrane protein [Aestuariivivens sp. NBU2969]